VSPSTSPSGALKIHQILGFSPNGAPILPNTANSTDPDVIRREKLGWEEISIQAAKIVSFIDLAGHERYLKTTLYGLTSGNGYSFC
jgi:GTPase